MKTKKLISLFKHLNNISNYKHPCLTAAIIYTNWREDSEVLYNGDHIIVKTDNQYIDNKGEYKLGNKENNFIPLHNYGKRHIKNSFNEVDWDSSLYREFLEKQF